MATETEIRTAVTLAGADQALRMISEQCDDLTFNAQSEQLEGRFKSEDAVEDCAVAIGLTAPAAPFGGRAIVVQMSTEEGWQEQMCFVLPGAAIAAGLCEIRGGP